ncbi:tRNA-uridine aminocarboxypropyltransferase [Shewanella gelidii]|uniref:tRNA-uridine aminocarboxypropyltransferase n=1 Tax=Shewanella gelidii TaxID=1642821 RepID=A0A917JX66_9GAMM|nr:tRNA-uridine aminocarboxypropyltransferase [Shewanella gelidii]MCL1098124.1 DTW domain-containing protein [Shewanella gelidii]GGI90690.1 DTW domain-containing protein [Shewanella gelidii]
MKKPEHAVHRLFQYRKAISSKPFSARGKNLLRCELCLLAQKHCTCRYRKQLNSNASFLLIMYDDEVLKPSNSGRLIADLIPDVRAYIWSRTHTNRKILDLLNHPQYQPFIVFPSEYATESQTVVETLPQKLNQNKKPLFVILDGSWREAIKMFRKSPYLHQLPMLSISPEKTAAYTLRKGKRDFQLGTAEVAALVLEVFGEPENANSLATWFSLFIESSLLSRSRQSDKDLSKRNSLIQQFAE